VSLALAGDGEGFFVYNKFITTPASLFWHDDWVIIYANGQLWIPEGRRFKG